MKIHRNNNKTEGSAGPLHGNACLWLSRRLKEGCFPPRVIRHVSARKQTKYQQQVCPSRTSAYAEMHTIITMINAVLDK